jgi:hypothetical protein
MLKSLILAASLALPLTAFAAEDKKPSGQQQRMASCNKEAKEKALNGEVRKKFMSSCLSTAKPKSAAAPT